MKNYSYEEVVDIIQNTRRFGSMTGYEVSKRMLEQLGNPQSGIPFVHVAGTNGKGSITAFLCKILEQTGKKVGMFTSPHLICFEERIRINGAYISREDVKRFGNLLLDTAFDVSPTMFDYCLAMAVLYFKEQQCDIMVMETGIGGRYDSTNALGVPELAIITKIGFDHTAILGDTLEEIAGEKAGIMKAGCPVVTSEQQSPASEVLLQNFREVNGLEHADFVRTKQQWEENAGEIAISKEAAIYMTSREDYRLAGSIPMKMPTGYQIENAATAIIGARVLGVSEEHIRAGISQTFWKGRMEIINENPFFMIDGAHNAHGVWALASSLKELYPNEKFHFIMGVMADKDYEEMIDALLPLAIDFVTVTPESNRALQSKDLAECIQKKGIKARFEDDMEKVIRPLLPRKNDADKNVTMLSKESGETHIYLPASEHKIIAFGSLYFIGAIEAMIEENSK